MDESLEPVKIIEKICNIRNDCENYTPTYVYLTWLCIILLVLSLIIWFRYKRLKKGKS